MKKCSFLCIIATLAVATTGLQLETSDRSLSTQDQRVPLIRKRINEQRRKMLEMRGNAQVRSTAVTFSNLAKAPPPNFLYCKGCRVAVDLLRYHVRTGRDENIVSSIRNTCILLNLQSSDVCMGIANVFGPELVPILNSTVNSLVICSFLLSQECTKVELPDWDIPLPSKPLLEPQVSAPPPKNGPRLKVLHLTDTHFDTYYTEGAKTTCDEPLCCHAKNGLATGNDRGAGKWGDWNCDIPEVTLDSMLAHASNKNPDLDYIIWTGDIPAHDIWRQTRKSNTAIIESTVAKIKRYFPNVPVYPAVGNHEAAPTDIFPPPGAPRTVSWLYETLDRQWRNWLPPETSETILFGGFYTTLARPGLRIVSLNTNYCYYRNWWLMVNSTDPANQLKWFVDVLQKAERNSEKVHVIAHVAPGQSDCLPNWRDNYYKIVSRFRKTIVNHFYGHSHKDEFELYFDEANKNEPVGVGFLGPSLTTYQNLNPGYRIYFVDGDRENSSRAVLDFENWVMDLERSNRNNVARWGRSYSAKSEYRMASLLPKEWNFLYENLKKNDQLFQLYYRHAHKDSPQINSKSCDSSCRESVLCNIRSCQKYKGV